MYITVYVLLSRMIQLLSCPSSGRTYSVQKVLNTYSYIRYLIFCLCKKKSVPITGPRCPEGSRKLRFPDYMTLVQDGGKVVSLMHWPLFTPRK